MTLGELTLLRRGQFKPGAVHGWLTIISRSDVKPGVRWNVRCRCGDERVVRECNMTRNPRPTVSCGCRYLKAPRPWVALRSFRHGHAARSPERKESHEYTVWQNMKRRCLDSNNVSFPDYGGRGIAVCERWMSFENFIADMGTRPTPKHQIDRINNDGNYEPGNCRWVTREVNGRNRRSTKLTESAVAEIRSMRSAGMGTMELARRFGVARTTIQRAVNGRQARRSSRPARSAIDAARKEQT